LLDAADGTVFVSGASERRVPYGDLVGNEPLSIEVDVASVNVWGPELKGRAPLKSPAQFRYSGTSVRRENVAEHASGIFEFVYDVRLPGMLHGRVVRPSAFGARLISLDRASIAGIPNTHVVTRGNFVGVVAELEYDAIRAACQLKTEWSKSETLYDQSTQF